MVRTSDLIESMPYVLPGEDTFALVIGAVIVGLLFFRYGLARRREDRADRNS